MHSTNRPNATRSRQTDRDGDMQIERESGGRIHIETFDIIIIVIMHSVRLFAHRALIATNALYSAASHVITDKIK